MKCDHCGRETTPLHTTDWIAAKRFVDVYTELRGNMQVKTTVTSYRNVAPLQIAICEPCLCENLSRTTRKSVWILSGVFLALTLLSLSVFASPKAGPALHAVVGVTIAVMWVFVLGGFIAARRERRVTPDSVRAALRDASTLAEEKALKSGRDSVFTPRVWDKLHS